MQLYSYSVNFPDANSRQISTDHHVMSGCVSGTVIITITQTLTQSCRSSQKDRFTDSHTIWKFSRQLPYFITCSGCWKSSHHFQSLLYTVTES
ncbi:hypothetical protein BaRGS_00031028 [Batillaria attramentaria]|uniref:Uncharacterized protein n=1 Tax=Batillaria attramentaria TaxID=370345 RepID=A0ABD0JRQ5_9CAEN